MFSLLYRKNRSLSTDDAERHDERILSEMTEPVLDFFTVQRYHIRKKGLKDTPDCGMMDMVLFRTDPKTHAAEDSHV